MDSGGNKRLIEAFYWFEPVRKDLNSSYEGSKTLWHYPEDPSAISQRFRDIPSFCYPELNGPKGDGLKIEKVGDVVSDQYIFTLTDKDGQRFYGICYRNFFRGISRRFDIGRRAKHCLCIITKFPYFALFKMLLKDIFSIGLLEHSRGVCKTFVYEMLDKLINEINQGQFTVSVAQLLPFPLESVQSLTNIPEFKFQIPKQSKFYLKDITILPIFQILGVDRFFKVLSAILCEQRILFISNDVTLLTNTIFSTLVMIYPFHWHHVFISLLPLKLINYLAAPVPYIIGIKKSVLAEVRRDIAKDVLVVDLDAGELIPNGDKILLLDLVGDSGNALKQASESLDRVRQGVASMFLGKSNSDNDAAAQRDLMAMLVLDLKAALGAKPGSSSLTSVASGLLRGLPGSVKTIEEAKAQWALETEKTIRESLTCFFVYLFADIDDFWVGGDANNSNSSATSSRAAPSGRGSSDFVFAPRDYRSKFDLKGFIHRKLSNGLSKLLHEFLMEFLHSQMFEKYCEEKYHQRLTFMSTIPTSRGTRSTSTASTGSTGSNYDTNASQEVEDLFDTACSELKYRQQVVNVANAKQAVTSRSMLHTGDNATTAGYGGSGRINLAGFHGWTLQYTASNDSESIAAIELFDNYAGSNGKKSQYQISQATILDRILQDLNNSDIAKKIINTISFRLESFKACGCRGSTAVSGIKALQLLQVLLIQGPTVILPLGLELIPLLRDLLKLNKQLLKGRSSNTFDFVVSGSFVSPRSSVLVVLGLLVDQRRLLVQRSIYVVDLQANPSPSVSEENKPGALARRSSATTTSLQAAANSNQPPRKELLVNATTHGKAFPSFQQIHTRFNELRSPSITPGLLRVTVPEKAAMVEREDDERTASLLQFDDENDIPNTIANSLPSSSSGGNLLEINEPAQPRSISPSPRSNSNISPAASSANISRGEVSPNRSPRDTPNNSSSNKISPTAVASARSIPPPVAPAAISNRVPPSKPPKIAAVSHKEIDLLGLESDDNAPYRLKNLDTVTNTETTSSKVSSSSGVNSAAIKLKPPPNDRTGAGGGGSSKRTPVAAMSSTSKNAQNDLLFGGDDFLTSFSASSITPPPSQVTEKSSDPFAASFTSDWATPAATVPSKQADPWGASDPFATSSAAFHFPSTTAPAPNNSAFPPVSNTPMKQSDPFASFAAGNTRSPATDPFGAPPAFPTAATPAFPPVSDPFASFNAFPPSAVNSVGVGKMFPAPMQAPFQTQPPPQYKPILTNPPPGYRPPLASSAPKDPFADLLNFDGKK